MVDIQPEREGKEKHFFLKKRSKKLLLNCVQPQDGHLETAVGRI
jgi:hypothetical protein